MVIDALMMNSVSIMNGAEITTEEEMVTTAVAVTIEAVERTMVVTARDLHPTDPTIRSRPQKRGRKRKVPETTVVTAR
jgi:hypothetical protein